MDWRSRISSDPEIIFGKPAIRGTRIGVVIILNYLAEGTTVEEILDYYPGITVEDVRACVAYASAVIERQQVAALTA